MDAKLLFKIIMGWFKKKRFFLASSLLPYVLCSLPKIYVSRWRLCSWTRRPTYLSPQHTTQTRIVLSLDLEFIASAITVYKSWRRKLHAFGWKLVVEALEGVRDATKLSRSTLVLIIRKNISQVVFHYVALDDDWNTLETVLPPAILWQ